MAFASDSTNLVANDTNVKTDVFVRSLDVATTARTSTNSSGAQAKNVSYDPVLSPDGNWVGFSSLASNLVSGDTNGTRDVFLKNLSTSKTIRVSVRTDGRQANGASSVDDVSNGGKQVVFHSYATNLVKNDANNRGDVFLRDRLAATTIRVSRDGPVESNGESFGASIAADGGQVVFQSWGTNLGDDEDTNGAASDLFEYTSRRSLDADLGRHRGRVAGRASYDAGSPAAGRRCGLRLARDRPRRWRRERARRRVHPPRGR